ncbi:MAG: tail fiber protein [Methylobacterium sp.]|nr:tail fiber protein [Methylobacterium sp.]
MIATWGGSLTNIPAGWLLCNGLAVSQTQYQNLFSAIGFNFGANPPAGQFYLPDLRGRFVRGVDDGSGRDPDVATRTDMQNPGITSKGVGSVQSHAFQNHTHPYRAFPHDEGDIASGRYWQAGQSETDLADASKYQVSSETRPINAYLYFIIAY